MHSSQEDLIAMLPTRIARLLLTGEHDGRYADDRAVLMAVIWGAAQADMRLDDLMRLIRNEAHAGAVWWQQHPDKSFATDHVSWCFGRSRQQTSEARATFRARSEVRLWLAAHVCWPGRTGDSDYRALVALITAAHDEGGRVFLASERVLTQYAFLSRSALVDALNRLVAAGIVKRTKLNGASSKYELHQAGWRVLLARTPEGVVRHPDERRIVQLKMRTPVTQFPVPALRPAELGPCIHLLLSKTPSNPKDQEECSHGPSSAASAVHAPGTGADWPFINKETSTRKWLPCHPAFGPRRLNQRVYLLCRNANPVPAEWIASVMGASVRAVREHLAKLVAAGLVREVGGKYLRCSDATRLLDQIAADNGGMSALRNMVARVKQDQLDYHGDPYIVDKLKLTDAYLAQFNEDPLIDPVPEPQPPAPSTPPIPEPPTAMQEVDQQDDEPLTIDDDMLAAIFDDIDFSQPEPQGETWQQRVDRYRDWPPTDEA